MAEHRLHGEHSGCWGEGRGVRLALAQRRHADRRHSRPSGSRVGAAPGVDPAGLHQAPVAALGRIRSGDRIGHVAFLIEEMARDFAAHPSFAFVDAQAQAGRRTKPSTCTVCASCPAFRTRLGRSV